MHVRATRSMASPLGALDRLRAWLLREQAALITRSPRTLPTNTSLTPAVTPRTSPLATGQLPNPGESPLVPFANERSNVRVIMVLAIGINGKDLPRLLDTVAKTSHEDDVVPIVVTDYSDFVALRERGLIFEYLPDEAQQKAHAAELEWDLYRLRRLALLIRKWRPGNTIAFGASSSSLLRRWQASPYWETFRSGGH
jgi:hypothetical protein